MKIKATLLIGKMVTVSIANKFSIDGILMKKFGTCENSYSVISESGFIVFGEENILEVKEQEIVLNPSMVF